MRRRLHLIFAAATVLLVAAWLLSGRWTVEAIAGPGSYVFVSVDSGCISLGFIETNQPDDGPWVDAWVYDRMGWTDTGYVLEWLADGAWRIRAGARRTTSLTIPLWIPAALTGIATPLVWRRHRLLRRERAGVCLACGYDLAGVPRGDDGTLRCPECGKRLRVKEWSAA